MSHSRFDHFGSRSVAVIGDIILDVYLTGDVNRISPEAPVPIVRWLSEKQTLGGAANVAANISALGARTRLVGLIGEDDGSRAIERLCEQSSNIDAVGVVRAPQRVTTQKTRLIGHNQQLVRIDREEQIPISREIEDALIAASISAIDESDIVVLSDYCKGALTDRVIDAAITYARKVHKVSIIDPKRKDFSAYRGASLVKPNRAELAAASGMASDTNEEVEAAARAIQQIILADMLVTRSEKGMSYVPYRGAVTHLPTLAKEVSDVSGAGDTVTAVLAVALAVGFTAEEAARLANHAGGIVVGRLGTSTVTKSELMISYFAEISEGSEDGQVVDLQTACSLRRMWRLQGLKVGFTNGCFDLLHRGHISLLKQASTVCDRLIVALNSDMSVRRLKGIGRPVQIELDRAEIIGAVKGVAAVMIFGENTPTDLVRALRPDVIIKGADYTKEVVAGGDIVEGDGGQIILADLVQGRSTTSLLKAIR